VFKLWSWSFLFFKFYTFMELICYSWKFYANYIENDIISYVPRGVLETTLCDDVCQCLAAGRWFSSGTPVFSTNTTDRRDIIELLLKVALNTITPHYHNYGTSVFLSYWTCLFKLCNLYATFIASWKYENFLKFGAVFSNFLLTLTMFKLYGDRRGRMIARLTTTCAISVCHHLSC